jgi:hypothetical protein
MDEAGFRDFLRRGGRSQSAIERCVRFVRDFEAYLRAQGLDSGLGEATPEDVDAYVEWVESAPKASAKTHLWALRYYFEFLSNEEMRDHVGELRQARIKRKPFVLGRFRGVNPAHVEKLADAGIVNVQQMLESGRTASGRRVLAERTGVPVEALEEFVRLSDLARLGGVKGIRARLYYDAGVDSIEKMAAWDPEELRAMLIAFVDRTGFEGIAPLPREARNAVETARKLPKLVDY